jgi:hypothetical protein
VTVVVVTLASVTVDSVTEDSVTVATDVVEVADSVGAGATVVKVGTVPVTVWSSIVAAGVELLGTVVGAAVSEGDAGVGAMVELASGTGATAAPTAAAAEVSGAGSGAGTTARKAATGKGMPRTPTTANADMRRCDGLTLCLRSYAFVHSAQLY